MSAIVVAFNPPPAAVHTVLDAAAQCCSVLVVDNTPAGRESALREAVVPTAVRVISLGENGGLAAALNRGVSELPTVTEAVLLLDQDSRLDSGAVRALAQRLREPTIAVVGPAPWDAAHKRYLDPRSSRRPVLSDMAAIITSGMLVRRASLPGDKPFREDFFVDCVDQDFCLKVRREGWRVVQDRSVILPHALGDTQWHRFFGMAVRATHHSEWRLYAATRNGITLSRENILREPRWAVLNVLQLAYWAWAVLLFEPPRVRRLRRMLQGLGDGLRGRSLRYDPPG